MIDQHDTRRQTLVTLLQQAAQAMVQELVARVAAAGFPDIRPADSRVFENLDAGGTRLTQLAARAQMTHQSMGELVASLEARGYLERRPDPTDQRARLVCFTPRGRILMRLALGELADIEATWLQRLGSDTGRDVRAALEQGFRANEGQASETEERDVDGK